MPDQKTMWTRWLGGFSVMWVTKLLISPVKNGFFAQEWPNLVPCWWVGWWLWRGLYLARHLFSFYIIMQCICEKKTTDFITVAVSAFKEKWYTQNVTGRSHLELHQESTFSYFWQKVVTCDALTRGHHICNAYLFRYWKIVHITAKPAPNLTYVF